MSELLTIELATPAVRPGGKITGRIRWMLSTPPDTGELRLRWLAEGEFHPESETPIAIKLAALEAAPDAEAAAKAHPYRRQTHGNRAPAPLAPVGVRLFNLRAPLSPVSFSGRLVSVSWTLEVEAGIALETMPLVISPTLAPVALRAPDLEIR